MFRRKNGDKAQIATLRNELAFMRKRLDDADRVKLELLNRVSTVADMSSQVEELTQRTAHAEATLAERDAAEVAREAKRRAAETDASAKSSADIEELRARLDEMSASVSTLEVRMTSISSELANQLGELSNDLEVLIDRAGRDADESANGVGVDIDSLKESLAARIDEQIGDAIDGVATSTERLAAEQARYQIQFRQDLAELADRLRRPAR